MTRLVERSDIVDYATYEDGRASSRPAALAAKAVRRVHLSDELTMLFENRETLRYQIQEIMRVERIVRESDIVHEINTYNEILGGPGSLGCALLIEVVDATERREKLTAWRGLQERIYVALDDGTRIYARFDPTQVGTDRISAVQYLQFPVQGRVPVAVGTDFEGLESQVDLTREQVAALDQDLARS